MFTAEIRVNLVCFCVFFLRKLHVGLYSMCGIRSAGILLTRPTHWTHRWTTWSTRVVVYLKIVFISSFLRCCSLEIPKIFRSHFWNFPNSFLLWVFFALSSIMIRIEKWVVSSSHIFLSLFSLLFPCISISGRYEEAVHLSTVHFPNTC